MSERAASEETRREVMARLQTIPNVGPAIAGDLVRLGVTDVAELARRDPDVMYLGLCRLDGARHDPCVRDVFAAAVDYARGEPARPWWYYSRQRKAREARPPRARRGAKR